MTKKILVGIVALFVLSLITTAALASGLDPKALVGNSGSAVMNAQACNCHGGSAVRCAKHHKGSGREVRKLDKKDNDKKSDKQKHHKKAKHHKRAKHNKHHRNAPAK